MRWMRRGLKVAVIGALAVAIAGFAVMSLWNWLMPDLFGLRAIGFWQALGLFVLSKLLFGGLHGRSSLSEGWRRRLLERWARMTPEEREKFRASLRERGGLGPEHADV